MKKILVLLLIVSGCMESSTGIVEVVRDQSGGETTILDRTSQAFTAPASNLNDAELEQHLSGDLEFESVFVTAPSPLNPGLGPTFNHTACNGCHISNGRGATVVGEDLLRSQMLVRVSLSDESGMIPADGGPIPVPGMGLQIQDHAVFGETPEAKITLNWIESSGEYPDGTTYTLRQPDLDIRLPDGSALPKNIRTSLRQPPPVFGLGLFEAVSESTILENSDPDDRDGDGISGRPNYVWSTERKEKVLGRFSWKANVYDLLEQTGGAYNSDMGVTNPIANNDDAGNPMDGPPEISRQRVEDATFYAQTLAVPAPFNIDAQERGRKLFVKMDCAKCHTESMTSDDSHPIEALRNQTFFAYTDLLLHDMGPGLADGRRDYEASGNEWRTAPLWGLGLTQTVAPFTSGFLHDGRARTIEEAILWHGGESKKSRENFKNLSKADRQSLLDFLQSL